MGKKKIALFYDTSTESGKQIVDFLMPFSKRKSDIVGELILLWINEHGTNVPVQWLDRSREKLGTVKPYFPPSAGVGSPLDQETKRDTGFTDKANQEGRIPGKAEGTEPDEFLIKAGLSAFM